MDQAIKKNSPCKVGRGSTQIGSRLFRWGERTYIMAVLNVTPDSFSGDGVRGNVDEAVETALRFVEDGADIIDIGGESTRPPSIYEGSEPVSDEEELARILPVISTLAGKIDLPISVDTYKARVANKAVDAGASLVNDVWGLRRDPLMASTVADASIPVVLMHNQKGTEYDDLVPDVIDELRQMTDHAVESGIKRENVILDPGSGFGKTAEQNLEILRRLDEFDVLERPLLMGMSRKSTIGYILDLPVDDRVEGTAATVTLSIAHGADIVRVHDVKEMARVAKMSDAIVRGWSRG